MGVYVRMVDYFLDCRRNRRLAALYLRGGNTGFLDLGGEEAR